MSHGVRKNRITGGATAWGPHNQLILEFELASWVLRTIDSSSIMLAPQAAAGALQARWRGASVRSSLVADVRAEFEQLALSLEPPGTRIHWRASSSGRSVLCRPVVVPPRTSRKRPAPPALEAPASSKFAAAAAAASVTEEDLGFAFAACSPSDDPQLPSDAAFRERRRQQLKQELRWARRMLSERERFLRLQSSRVP